MGKHTGRACVEACIVEKKSDPNINGVTVYSDGNRKQCWCERNMSTMYKSLGKYSTCFVYTNGRCISFILSRFEFDIAELLLFRTLNQCMQAELTIVQNLWTQKYFEYCHLPMLLRIIGKQKFITVNVILFLLDCPFSTDFFLSNLPTKNNILKAD